MTVTHFKVEGAVIFVHDQVQHFGSSFSSRMIYKIILAYAIHKTYHVSCFVAEFYYKAGFMVESWSIVGPESRIDVRWCKILREDNGWCNICYIYIGRSSSTGRPLGCARSDRVPGFGLHPLHHAVRAHPRHVLSWRPCHEALCEACFYQRQVRGWDLKGVRILQMNLDWCLKMFQFAQVQVSQLCSIVSTTQHCGSCFFGNKVLMSCWR